MMFPPEFQVGHEMSLQIVGLLLEEPLLSNSDIAMRFGANPESTFFKTDLSIARIILSDPDKYHLSEEFQRLSSSQSRNVMLCVGLEVCRSLEERFGNQSREDLETWMDILSFLSEHPLSIHHIEMALRTMKLQEAISNLAGDTIEDSETIIMRYLEEDPDFLIGDSGVDENLLKRSIAGVSQASSVIDFDDLISSMFGPIDMEDRQNGLGEQTQDSTQGNDQ